MEEKITMEILQYEIKLKVWGYYTKQEKECEKYFKDIQRNR